MTASKGSIAGKVVDAAGGAIAGATVALVSGSQPFPDIAVITAADGTFLLGGILAGTYGLEARRGTVRGLAEFTLAEDEDASVEVVIA